MKIRTYTAKLGDRANDVIALAVQIQAEYDRLQKSHTALLEALKVFLQADAPGASFTLEYARDRARAAIAQAQGETKC